jgi:hypothetical protein
MNLNTILVLFAKLLKKPRILVNVLFIINQEVMLMVKNVPGMLVFMLLKELY